MSAAIPLITGLLGAAGIGASVLGYNTEMARDEANYKLQKEHFEYQKGVQKTIWERDDNAVQRRVNDMRLAGISPHAAAGGAAQSSGPIGTKAPQRQPGVDTRGASLISSALNTMANIAQTTAQTAALQAQTRNVELKTRLQEGTASDTLLAAKLRNQYTGLQSESLQSDINVKRATEGARIYQAEIAVEQAQANFDLFQQKKGPIIRKLVAEAGISEDQLKVAIETTIARIQGEKAKSRLTQKEDMVLTQTMTAIIGQEHAKELAADLKNEDMSKMPPRRKVMIDAILKLTGQLFGFFKQPTRRIKIR